MSTKDLGKGELVVDLVVDLLLNQVKSDLQYLKSNAISTKRKDAG